MNFNDLNEIEGLQFIPVNDRKIPIVKDWQNSIKKYDLSKGWGVGLVCGKPSSNLECIDIDLKYDLSGTLYNRYKTLIERLCPGLLKKMVVQKTVSGGYHFFYRVDGEIDGNKKLANRPSTPEEKNATYQKTKQAELEKGADDEKASKIAEKARENDKVRVLIETRGTGGQFVCAPTNGYTLIFGDLFSVSTISHSERDVLISAAMSLNEYFEEIVVPAKVKHNKDNTGLSPFEDYDQQADVVKLLIDHGWTIDSRGSTPNVTKLLRPGDSKAQNSGNFNHEKGWFSVFSTSTDFEAQKAYKPYAVFAVLECHKDFSEASKKLWEMGYGERKAKPEEKKSTREIYPQLDPKKEDLSSYFVTGSDYGAYLEDLREDRIVTGYSTGIPILDKYFLIKKGNLVMNLGVDNVGKTAFSLYLFLLGAMYHGFKYFVYASENEPGQIMRTLMQLFMGKSINKNKKNPMTDDELKMARDFVEKHFRICRSETRLMNYKDMMALGDVARMEHGCEFGLIDPFNSLKIDLSGFSKLSTHEYQYQALSELKFHGRYHNFGWYINMHAVTGSAREKDADRAYSIRPRKADAEGGQKNANKADEFLVTHRLANHPTDWNITDIYVDKVKDTETGGRQTIYNKPVRLKRYTEHSFSELIEDEIQGTYEGIDPVLEWHIEKGGRVSSKKILTQQTFWTPFKDEDGNEVEL